MSLMTYVLTSTASFALVILCVGRQRGLDNSKISTLIGGGLLISLFFAQVMRDSPPWPIYPLFLLLGAGFLATCLYPREVVPRLHEGEIAMMFLTCSYLLGEEAAEIKYWAFGLSLPLTLILVYELVSQKHLGRKSRIALSILFSLMCTGLCTYQIFHSPSIFYSSVANDGTLKLFIKSFVFQFSIFWAGLHAFRLFGLIPSKDARYDRETMDDLVSSVSQVNIPMSSVALACIVHGVPLFLNSHFQWIPAPLMVSYAALVSPYLVEKILAAAHASDASDDSDRNSRRLAS